MKSVFTWLNYKCLEGASFSTEEKKKNSFTPVSLHNDEMLFRNNIKAREIYKEKCSYELHVQGCMCVLGGVDWWFWDFALGVFTSEIFT